jgi:hypothetical protein
MWSARNTTLQNIRSRRSEVSQSCPPQPNDRTKNELYVCQGSKLWVMDGIHVRKTLEVLFYFFFELTRAANAGDNYWNCEIRDQAMRCSSAHPLLANTPYEGLEQKLTLALHLSKSAETCSILTFDSTVAGALDPPHITKIEMLIGYTCDIPPDLTQSTYRVKESGTERYNFNCALREFKFYAAGFDTSPICAIACRSAGSRGSRRSRASPLANVVSSRLTSPRNWGASPNSGEQRRHTRRRAHRRRQTPRHMPAWDDAVAIHPVESLSLI